MQGGQHSPHCIAVAPNAGRQLAVAPCPRPSLACRQNQHTAALNAYAARLYAASACLQADIKQPTYALSCMQ